MMINSDTLLYAVFGNPVKHSKSPLIHNWGFGYYRLNAVYLAFEIEDIQEGLLAVRRLNIRGASITIPFKTAAMAHLDYIDPDADSIGAVNTIVNRNGKLSGYNTDCQAAVLPLIPLGIKGKTVCIIGAGGAAQAVAHGIQKHNGRIIVLNRRQEPGEALAEKVNGRFVRLDDVSGLESLNADVLINTTPVGMSPDIDAMPIPSSCLHPHMIVMDIIYTPLKTKLLIEAEKKGCRTIDGLSMFIHQGAAQFKLWTGLAPDPMMMRTAALSGDT